MQVLSRPPSGWPALVLNADFRPLSYYPLSLWPWQEVVKAVFLERVDVVAHYDKVIHSPELLSLKKAVIEIQSGIFQLELEHKERIEKNNDHPVVKRIAEFLGAAFMLALVGVATSYVIGA